MGSQIKLVAPFASAKDTANILGVTNARLEALRKILADSVKPASAGRGPNSLKSLAKSRGIHVSGIRTNKRRVAAKSPKNVYRYSVASKVKKKK
jgi:hypothetical protein